MSAAYEFDAYPTDSESFRLEFRLEDDEGVAFDPTGKTLEYVLTGCGTDLRLDGTNGVSFDPETGYITVAPDPEVRLRAGTYQHGFRTTDANNLTIQHFDGEVAVSKGYF